MNRHDYEEAVYASTLDSYSKQILIYYGYKKHWTKAGQVWPSAESIAKATGISQRTVEDRIPKLRDLGWLTATGAVKTNGKGRPSVVYDLTLGRNPRGKGQVLNRTAVGTLPQESRTFTASVADLTAPLADEVSKEEVIEEVKEEETVADAPVVPLVGTKEVLPKPSLAEDVDTTGPVGPVKEDSPLAPNASLVSGPSTSAGAPVDSNQCVRLWLELLDKSRTDRWNAKAEAALRRHIETDPPTWDWSKWRSRANHQTLLDLLIEYGLEEAW